MKFSLDRKWYVLLSVSIFLIIGLAYYMNTEVDLEESDHINENDSEGRFEFVGYTLPESESFSDVEEVSVVLSNDIFEYDEVTTSDQGYINGMLGDSVGGVNDDEGNKTHEEGKVTDTPIEGNEVDVVKDDSVSFNSENSKLYEEAGVFESDYDLVDSMIDEFSSFDMGKVRESSRGVSSYGYMQVTEATAKDMVSRLGIEYSFSDLKDDRVYNIRVGYEYLKYIREFSEDPHFVITAYVYGVDGAKSVFKKSGTYVTEISKTVLSRID